MEYISLIVFLILIILLLIKKIPRFIKVFFVFLSIFVILATYREDDVAHEGFMISIEELKEEIDIQFLDFYHLDHYLHHDSKTLISESKAINSYEGENYYYTAFENRMILVDDYRVNMYVSNTMLPGHEPVDKNTSVVETPNNKVVVTLFEDYSGTCFNFKMNDLYVYIELEHSPRYTTSTQMEEAILQMIDEGYEINLEP